MSNLLYLIQSVTDTLMARPKPILLKDFYSFHKKDAFDGQCTVGRLTFVENFSYNLLSMFNTCVPVSLYGPRQANLVLIVYASSKGSGEPAHSRSLARNFAARSYKQ